MKRLRTAAIVLGLSLSLMTAFGQTANAAPPSGGGGRLTAGVSGLPPGVCYDDTIGTYYCRFKILFPW